MITIPIEVIWPVDLPLPYIDFQGATTNGTIVGKMPLAISRRSRFTQAYFALTLKWVLDETQLATFVDFFQNKVDNACAHFPLLLRYPLNSALTEWLVQFTGEFSKTNLDGMWEVAANVMVARESQTEEMAERIE